MNKFKQIWKNLSADGKRGMADRLDTHKDYLSQIAHGHRKPGKHFKAALEAEMKKLEQLAA